MGPLHPLYEDRKHDIQDHQHPYADSPFDNQPVIINPEFKLGHDVATLKSNIMIAHAFGLLPTRALFESIQEQGTLDRIKSHAANYAQKQLDTGSINTVTEYRQTMAEYVNIVATLPSQRPELEEFLFASMQENTQGKAYENAVL